MSTHRLATASCALGVLTYVAFTGLRGVPQASADDGVLPEQIELTGTVRDFREVGEPNGHPDFEVIPDHGYGHYTGNIATSLGPDGVPMFVGGGRKVNHQWKDSQGRPICWNVAQSYPQPGDHPGSMGPHDNGGIQSAQSFNQWSHKLLVC